MKELHLGAVTMNDQGGWHVFKAVPEWICSLCGCVCPCRTKAQERASQMSGVQGIVCHANALI